jgi:hypothetical protein
MQGNKQNQHTTALSPLPPPPWLNRNANRDVRDVNREVNREQPTRPLSPTRPRSPVQTLPQILPTQRLPLSPERPTQGLGPILTPLPTQGLPPLPRSPARSPTHTDRPVQGLGPILTPLPTQGLPPLPRSPARSPTYTDRPVQGLPQVGPVAYDDGAPAYYDNRAILTNFKVDVLKTILKNLRLPVSGNKPVLIDRILNRRNLQPRGRKVIPLIPPEQPRPTQGLPPLSPTRPRSPTRPTQGLPPLSPTLPRSPTRPTQGLPPLSPTLPRSPTRPTQGLPPLSPTLPRSPTRPRSPVRPIRGLPQVADDGAPAYYDDRVHLTNNLRNHELKAILKNLRLPVSGNKAALIDRILNRRNLQPRGGRRIPVIPTIASPVASPVASPIASPRQNVPRQKVPIQATTKLEAIQNLIADSFGEEEPEEGILYNKILITDYLKERLGSKANTNNINYTYGGRLVGFSLDDNISLFWWGKIYPRVEDRIKRKHTLFNYDINVINKLSTKELNDLIPKDWPYPRDRASIFFKILTGYNPPRADATKEPRYESIIKSEPEIVFNIAAYVYNYFGVLDRYKYAEFYSHYSPARHVSLQDPSILEPFIPAVMANRNQARLYGQQIGMMIPENIPNEYNYFLENLYYYQKVLTRDPNRLVPVPEIQNRHDAARLLEIYTDNEILEGYGLGHRHGGVTYAGRKDLIDKVVRYVTNTDNRWHFRHSNCINSDRPNIIMLDPREDEDDDPLISYGTLNNYRCWNADELAASWEPVQGVISFNVPDWKPGDPYKTFSTDSINRLKELLLSTNKPYFNVLIQTINAGLDQIRNAGARVQKYRADYLLLNDKDKNLVREYLAWLFFASMYMRFWKGPGNPYPAVWVEGGGGENRCTTEERSRLLTDHFIVRTRILEQMGKDLEEWVLSFPRIEYNFVENIATVGVEPINFIVEQAQIGNFCLAEGSDHLVQTSYYIATKILNTDMNGFNNMLNEILKINQPPFDPLAVTRTRHVDPHHRLKRL